MKKLIRGVVDFREKHLLRYRRDFAHLAQRQMPDALFIACSDSRVVPNTFASTDPGDLFVVRNVGNLVCPCGAHGVSSADESEVAAMEFAIHELRVSDIIVCGHSECGAMLSLLGGEKRVQMPHLESWLRHGHPALTRWKAGHAPDPSLSPHNQLSQINVLVQLENLRTYQAVRARMEQGTLRLHGWWFCLETADVQVFDEKTGRFRILDADVAAEIMARLEEAAPAKP